MQRNAFQGRWPVAAGIVSTVGLLLLSAGCHPHGRWRGFGPPPADPVRAIWVTRWDYKRPRDIEAIMSNAARAGFNTVLFQVRGNGTAFYRSKIEPWADELGAKDPGFDPLRIACREAHARDLALHAWVNVMPGWRGKEPPANPRQLYHAHPDWFWRDAAGHRQPLGWYNSLNPCYPEVRRYLVAVMNEILAGYPVDGVHLDYIRFPNDVDTEDYPRDPRTLAMFHRATGKTPDTAPAHWSAWRAACVTQLVREINAMVRRTDPRVQLSAAVGAEPDEARRKHYQDAPRWLAEGLLDAVYPMNYAEDMPTFERRLRAWEATAGPVPIVMGVLVDWRDPRLVANQLARVRRHTPHVAIFAYNSLFERLDDNGRPMRDEQSRSRVAVRRSVVTGLRAAQLARY